MGKTTKADLRVAAYEALLARRGTIGPADLVEAARDPASPLHELFEWDDRRAGEQYRLAQASELIRRWKGVVVRVDERTREVRVEAVRRVQSPSEQRGPGQRSYESVEAIMADPVKRDDMIRTALRELQAYRKRYAGLAALSDIWRAIDDAIELHMPPEPVKRSEEVARLNV